MSPPAFSVIIAVFNGEATIARAIESILAQSRPAAEIIVVDDGSTDDTAGRVASFGDAVRYIRQPNQGVSVARNRGVEEAKEEWLAFLDADDWYYPDRLRWHSEWIDADPDIDFLTGDFDYVEESGDVIRRSMMHCEAGKSLLDKAGGGDRAIMEGDDLGLFVEKHFGDTHTLSLPRETFLRLGGYPAGVAVCEDVNLLIRLTAASRRVGVVCRPMAAYMIHGGSATRSDPIRAQRQTVQALLPLVDQLDGATPAIRRGLMGSLRRARLDLAYALLRSGRRVEALRAVAPLLKQNPGLRSVRDVLSIMRGVS